MLQNCESDLHQLQDRSIGDTKADIGWFFLRRKILRCFIQVSLMRNLMKKSRVHLVCGYWRIKLCVRAALLSGWTVVWLHKICALRCERPPQHDACCGARTAAAAECGGDFTSWFCKLAQMRASCSGFEHTYLSSGIATQNAARRFF